MFRSITFIPLILLLLTGCNAGITPNQGAVVPLTTDCTLAYRSGPGSPIEGEETVTLSDGAAKQTRTFTDLVFQADYFSGQNSGEGRSLRLTVSNAAGQMLAAQLYQLDKTGRPSNQFQGGHGFTGLHYTYHPASGAELQYWCVARRPDNN